MFEQNIIKIRNPLNNTSFGTFAWSCFRAAMGPSQLSKNRSFDVFETFEHKLSRVFKFSMRLENLTDLDTKCTKRSVIN